MNFRIPPRIVPTLLLILVCAGQAHAGAVSWQPDWSNAVAQSQRDHRWILVDFYTDWCGWCKKLDADVYPNPAVATAMTQFVPVRLNAEKAGKALAERYMVTSYPTILILDSSGNVVDRSAGYMKAPDFAQWLNDLVRSGSSPGDAAPVGPPDNAGAPNEPPASREPAGGSPPASVAPHNTSVIHMSRIRETTKFIPTHQGDPEEPPATMALAQKYLDRGDTAGAGRTVVKLARGGGAVPAAFYCKLGSAALQSKKADASWGWFQMAVKAAKTPADTAYAQVQCARAELALGSAAQAAAHLKSVAESADAPETIKLQARALLSAAGLPPTR